MVYTLSRPSDKDIYDITKEDLVMAALRFDPDVICVGEMRDAEAHSAVEASSTDHTVVTTVHPPSNLLRYRENELQKFNGVHYSVYFGSVTSYDHEKNKREAAFQGKFKNIAAVP